MPIMGDPDPDTLWRLDLFHNADGPVRSNAPPSCMVTPMMKMSHEGFGRAVLTTGRLIVVNRYLRDVHRFGYAEPGQAGRCRQQAGEPKAWSMIQKYPEVAHLWLMSTP